LRGGGRGGFPALSSGSQVRFSGLPSGFSSGRKRHHQPWQGGERGSQSDELSDVELQHNSSGGGGGGGGFGG